MACLLLVGQRAAQVRPRQLTWIELEKPAAKSSADDTKTRTQIVQTRDGHESKVAEQDAYLGQKTQTVDRETVSEKRSTVMGETARAKTKTQAKAADAKPPQARADVERAAGPLAKFGISVLPTTKEVQEQSRDEPRWAAQGGSPEDYVKGVKESDRTLLNTKEYVFYGYFQRIRSRLDRAWIPILRVRLASLYKTGRQLASDMDHTTRVLVVLNDGGEVIGVKIKRESGTQDLDEAAIRAFNAAGPFPNPPKGIVDANNQVLIPWEFILKT
jgi:protein TonB